MTHLTSIKLSVLSPTPAKKKAAKKNYGFVYPLKPRSTYAPRAYQQQLTEFLLSQDRAVAVAPPGAGKTLLTLAALTDKHAQDKLYLKLRKEREGTDRPIPKLDLIIAPPRVARDSWPSEANKWSNCEGYFVLNLAGLTKSQRLKAWTDIQYYSAVAINRESFPGLLELLYEVYGQIRFEDVFRRLVYDEASQLRSFRLPNAVPFVNGALYAPKYKQVGSKYASMIFFASLNLANVWLLTGTPNPNGVENLYGLTLFCDYQKVFKYKTREGIDYYQMPSASLGALQVFYATYFRERQLENGHMLQIPLPNALPRVVEKIKHKFLTVDPASELDIKKQVINLIYVDLPEKARTIYAELEENYVAELTAAGVQINAVNAAVAHGKLLQIANGQVYIESGSSEYEEIHDEKLQALDSLVEELDGEPLLVVYNLKSDLDRILKRFNQAKVLKTEKDFADWNARKITIGLIHPASAGHGLSLQHGGHNLCFYGLTYDLELFAQVRERIGPLRQLQSNYNRLVYEHYILAKDTIDEDTLQVLHDKGVVMADTLELTKRRNLLSLMNVQNS